MIEEIKEALSRIQASTHQGMRIIMPRAEIEITKDKFHKIDAKPSSRKMIFIDGGQTSVFSSATLHIEYIRVYAGVWGAGNRIESVQEESILITKTAMIDGRMAYQSEEIPARGRLPVFALNDDTLTTRHHNAQITSVANAIRANKEYELAIQMMERHPGSTIIKDGDLDVHHSAQADTIKECHTKADSSGCALVGVSKTTTLLTETGASIVTALNNAAPPHPWAFIDKGHAFCRFDMKSPYIFRIDGADLEAINEIAANATDPGFPGYPYGLVDADARARLGHEEGQYIRALFEANAGERMEELRTLASATDGHRMLDRMRYR